MDLLNQQGVEKVFVVKFCGGDVAMGPKDMWYHVYVPTNRRTVIQTNERGDPLFILYTSGSTGKPKGLKHTTGGYLVYAWLTSSQVFD